jgi:hypothetical protein
MITCTSILTNVFGGSGGNRTHIKSLGNSKFSHFKLLQVNQNQRNTFFVNFHL